MKKAIIGITTFGIIAATLFSVFHWCIRSIDTSKIVRKIEFTGLKHADDDLLDVMVTESVSLKGAGIRPI